MSDDLKKRLAGLSPEKRELLLAKLRKAQKSAPRAAINVRPDASDFPLSHSQKGFWVLEQLNAGLAINNIPSAVRIKGALNIEAFKKALNHIVQRHQILRANFKTEKGRPKQTIRPFVELDVPLTELTFDNESEKEERLQKLIHEEATRPFDISRDLLLRVKLIKIKENDHVLCTTFHHIVADAWSVGVFVRELLSAYQAYASGQNPASPPLPIQYFDYAYWQEKFINSAEGQEQIAYWEKQLDEPQGRLELPYDFSPSSSVTNRGFHLPFDLGSELSARVLEFCKQEKITPFVFLEAVFSLLLAKLTNRTDIRIGTPVANRDKPELANLIGLFINVVILKNEVADHLTFRDYLNRVRQTITQAVGHATIPLEILINKLFPDRDTSDNPLSNVLFDFQEVSLQKGRFGPLEVEPLELETGSIKFDLVLSINITDGLIRGSFGYKSDLFKKETVERFIKYFKNLTRQAIQNPDTRSWQLPILDAVEQNHILENWSRGRQEPLPAGVCVHQRFELRVEESPQAIALIDYSKSDFSQSPEKLTYAELNRRANQIAHYLISQNIGPGDIVGLAINRSNRLFMALLGILKAGAAYLPIDPNYPQERIRYILDDSKLRLILTEENLAEYFKESGADILPIDANQPLLAQFSTENPQVPVPQNALAYLIYTSGSTGKPKAVMVPHRSLLNHTRTMCNEYEFTAGEKILQYISISFDAAAEEIYPALMSGASLVLPGHASELSGFDLLNLIQKEQINIMHVPVPVWHYFIDFLSERGEEIPQSIRMMLAGGEQPSIQKFRQAARLLQNKKAVFVNLYGPTETTIASTFFHTEMDEEKSFEYNFIPIGKPIPNDRVYLLDRALQPVPQGVLGEIYIGGFGVTHGYLNRPDLTAERFLPDPFSKEPGARMYRTGDLGRFNSNGEIIFAGRVDFQVKIRGFRIELGEIEAAIERHPSVKQCVVFAQEQNGSEKKLVAYIVPQNKDDFSEETVRHWLAERLPDYMIPSFFVTLKAIPLTPTGKVDRKALPDPFKEGVGAVGENYVPPTTRLEKFLYDMWKDILGMEQIGIHDNFFQLGGSSIQAATFVNRLQDALGEYVYIVAIYDAPTIAGLCELLKKDYPDAVYRITGEKVEKREEKERISEEQAAFFQNIIKTPGPHISVRGPKNPPAVFVISAPRSGSTLTRAILGGHPKLFAPPELQLLNFNTLQERKNNLTGRDDFWLDGTIRAIMEIKECDADEARKIMAEFEEKDYSVKDFYRVMQEWLGDRLFVDKTPNYALSADILRRAEAYFENAIYIHLIRHPYGVIPSFEKARLHVFYPPFFTQEHPFNSRQLAELVWLISHRNILTFLQEIPPERQFRLYYEDLVQEPEKTIQSVCDFLGIDLHPDMLEPQKNSHKRMLDGLNDLSKMLGDVRFHEHKGISADRAYSWKRTLTEDYLSDLTWQLVEELGYEKRKELEYSIGKVIRPIEPLKPDEKPQMSFAQQRLWFLDQLEPDNPFYNMPMTVRIKGPIKRHLLEKAINKVVERHENLRTAFKTVNGQPEVEILPRLHTPIEWLDLSQLSPEEQNRQIETLIKNEASTPFKLSQAPLFRARLIQLQDDEAIFILNMHHIISDGLSLEIMIKEVSAFYQALLQGKEAQLPPLPFQYSAYAKWQRQWLESEVLQKQLRFWQNQLSGAPQLLKLPTDFPRPKVQSFKGSKTYLELPAELSAKIKAIANRHRTTPYVVLLSAFSILLHRYSGQDDLVIGTPVSGRTRKEIENLIGFFVNSIPLRFELEGNPSFDELLEQVQKMVQDSLANQDAPFEKIIDALNLERDTSYTPLFQVMFIYQQNPLKKMALSNLEIEPLQVETGTSKFDLSLAMIEDEDQFRGMVEYNTALFKAQTIEKFIEHFTNLLRDIAQDEQKPVRALNLLSEAERERILSGYDRFSRKPVSEHVNVVALFEELVKNEAQHPAILTEDAALTYDQLNRRANQLAHYLNHAGIGQEDVVAIALERSPELFVGLLGVLKSGAAYLPIDPHYPQERIDYILNDSGVKLVLTQKSLAQRFAGHNGTTLALDDAALPFDAESAENPRRHIEPENLAYLIYTSGSTGKPKAVMVEHRSLVNHALAIKEIYQLTPEDRMLQYISISFDAAAEEIYPTLLSGAALALAPSATEMTGADLVNIIKRHQISILHLPVPMWHYFIDYLNENNLSIPDSVRMMLVGGEAPSIQKFQLAGTLTRKPVVFMNMYGPTEATITSLYYKTLLDATKNFAHNALPIGQAINNVRVYILDTAMNPVPTGVAGEIYIGGAGVTRGYLNRPDLTAERFVPDPFSSEPGQRLYRTGDLGYFNQQGEVVFAGRVDFQVKIRGFRIELGEIENALEQHPGVKEAIVLARSLEGADKLVAYLIPEQDASLTIAELRDFLARTLPDYMIPSYFVALEKFPVTATGKIDRKRLPEPQISEDRLEKNYVAPRNEREKMLAEIWQEVLKLPKIGVKDNFFELGGDSILSIQVIARANQKGLKISPRQLFEYPTIEGLASVAEEGIAIQAEQGLVSGSFPLTPIQNWFFDLNLNQPAYWNQSLTIRLREPLNTEILSQITSKILEHHDVLRATFVQQDGKIVAEIPAQAAQNPFFIHDLRGLSGNTLNEKLQNEALKAQSGFDLSIGPLIRFDYFQTDEHDLLQITIHHLIVDTVSWRILSEDILQAYNQLLAGKEVILSPKTTSFKYWAEKLQQYAQSEEVARELDFWRQQIEGPPISLPVDNPVGKNVEQTADSVKVALGKEETEQLLREAPAAYNTQINELLLAALLRAYYRWSGQSDLLLDLEGHGREDLFEDVNISRTVGWFTVSHPLRLKYDSTWQPSDLIRQVKEQYRAVPNHGIGYGLLRYLRKDANALIPDQPAPIGFNYLGQFEQENNQAGDLGEPIPALAPERAPENQRIHLIEIGGNVVNNVLNMNFSFSAEQFKKETVERFAKLFTEELKTLIEHCLSPEAGGYTASDFKEAGIDDEDLDALLEELE
ncbi:amino acid adenylation domain protein [Caldithrix abyssi DSM 13497]|uniref:Amino acid adenylation domain protein n=1 Tax=Caldithrix abyssi DSM 13497 TaxID=880073 RepID=H1XP63_CALAY|nr:non-ribosomal peptide synthetase [Caldithrix abyssi]APF18146.1 non-ribosomal peptide synthase domain TIGR01720/amino acid adenylation domain-containing protein [Caldithrix abyssi DSM 13497]EHO42178.1 amino acid adenylation domain protein [Caldithrix abyssi DSM 13497]